MPRSTRPYIVGAVTVAGASMLATTATVAQSSNEETTLTIATVDNREMVRMQELASVYEEANPGVTVEFETLGESTLRQRVITDIATDGGGYDIVTIGTYEVPIWGEREWLLPLDDMPADYNAEDLLPAISEALSYEGTQYASPFYGESTFTMYRTDLFDEAGLQMPEQPTWEFIMEAAEQLDSEDVNGVCLRGAPGWGENVALITAMANSYGARWFDDAYAPQLNSADWRNALGDYTSMLQAFGPDNASELGYNGNLELFQEGSCAIWVDATVAGSALTDEDESRVANEVGFALAPGTGLEVNSNWLWAWSLAVPESTDAPEAAKDFVAWATSQEYTELVAAEDGWANVPPGTRTSLYETQEYTDAAPFAELALESIESADPNNPTVEPVPYTGIQYVAIPSFPSIGTAVGNRFALAVEGEITVEEALENAQWVTGTVIQQSLTADE